MKINLEKFPVINLKNQSNTGILNYKLNFGINGFNLKNKILFPKKAKLNFWSYESNLAKKTRGRMVELIFFGLNYNAKRIKHFRKPYVLDLQKSHKIKVNEQRISTIKTKVFKRRILFWSYDRSKLMELMVKLKKQRPQNSYSGHGLLERNDGYKIKPGKIRQK